MAELHDLLLAHFDAHRRDLPFRGQGPYRVWVSEIMLQQTQVSTMLPYYERWMRRFPNLESLQQADESEVLALWQGLGYYRRARQLLEAARSLRQWPTAAADWLKLPGVGPYVAGAVASIAFNEPAPLVDGNVARVYARLEADSAHPDQLMRNAWDWAGQLMCKERPGDWNQALMELGATICKPGKPLCAQCPVRTECKAFEQEIVEQLPTRRPRKEAKEVALSLAIPVFENQFGIQTISGRWWKGLWGFPQEKPSEQIRETNDYLLPLTATVTNHRITFTSRIDRYKSPDPEFQWTSFEGLKAFALPSPHAKLARLANERLQRVETRL